MKHAINCTAYGAGKRILEERVLHISADTIAEAIGIAQATWPEAQSVVIRGVTPSDEPNEDVPEVLASGKRGPGRPRKQ